MKTFLIVYVMVGIAFAEMWIKGRKTTTENEPSLQKGYLLSLTFWPLILVLILIKIAKGDIDG